MNPVIDNYTVDLASNNNFFFITAIQGDGHSTRYVDISILDHQQAYLLDENEVIPTIQGMKPDNNTILNTGDIVGDNTVRFEITPQMTAVNGSGQYEIAIYALHYNQKLTSFPFNIVIKKSSIDPNAVTSSSEFSLLTKKIVETVSAISNTQNATADAIQATSDANAATSDCREVIDNANNKISEMDVLGSELSEAEAIRVVNENERIANENTRKESFSNMTTSINEATNNAIVATQNANAATEETNNATTNCLTATSNATNITQEMNNLKGDLESSEAIRVSNENTRITNENARNVAETTRQTTFEANEANRQLVFESDKEEMDQATSDCNSLITAIQQKLENGEFNGADGVVTTIDGQYTFQIIDGYLCLIYLDDATPPNYSINEDGYLILTIEEGT